MFWLFCFSFLQKAYPGQGGGRETFAGSTEESRREFVDEQTEMVYMSAR